MRNSDTSLSYGQPLPKPWFGKSTSALICCLDFCIDLLLSLLTFEDFSTSYNVVVAKLGSGGAVVIVIVDYVSTRPVIVGIKIVTVSTRLALGA